MDLTTMQSWGEEFIFLLYCNNLILTILYIFRFPCFRSELINDTAFLRFHLETEYKIFWVAFLVPSILLVISCIMLVICQKTVVTGDDSKMRFKCVAEEEVDIMDNTGDRL